MGDGELSQHIVQIGRYWLFFALNWHVQPAWYYWMVATFAGGHTVDIAVDQVRQAKCVYLSVHHNVANDTRLRCIEQKPHFLQPSVGVLESFLKTWGGCRAACWTC